MPRKNLTPLQRIVDALLAPFRALLDIGVWIGLVANSEIQIDSSEEPTPLWKRMLFLPFYVFASLANLFLLIVSYPFSGWIHEPQLRKHLLFGLPALIGTLLVVGLSIVQSVEASKSQALYFEAFEKSERSKEYESAKLYASRLIQVGEKESPETMFRYCKLLAADNDLERANAILESLAPNDAPGYAPAHAQRAIAYASMIARGGDQRLLEPLRWHLSHSNDRKDERLALARASYFQASQQFVDWIRSLELAAKLNPDHWLSIANIMIARKDGKNAQQALILARDSFRRKLSEDPLSIPLRIRLIEALVRLQQFDEAEQTIQVGAGFHPDRMEMKQAKGALERARLLSMQESKRSDDELFDQIMLVMSYPEQEDFAVDRMVYLYGEMRPENQNKIRTILEQKSKADPSSPLIQLSLSIVALTDQRIDDAQKLLERTLELDPTIHMAKNNLAWLLSERDPTQLERAIKLSQEAVAALPNMPSYRDTLGTLLLMKGDTNRAITELERALPGMPESERGKLCTKLAKAYKAVGNDSLAKSYQAKADQLAQANTSQ
jgi:tetratricopeptide (TPR) repeat protein